MRRRVFLTGAMSAALSAFAAPSKTIEALSGDRFRIDGADYLLSDILAPSQYRLEGKSEAYFEQARAALGILISGGDIALSKTGDATRWGEKRVRAQIVGDGQPLQERLVSLGAARVAPYTDDFDFIRNLFELETEARKERRGLWALSAYQLLNADNAWLGLHSFALVEGLVTDAKEVKGRVYLNFGADFRKDFTATTLPRNARRWAKQGIELLALSGARLRIRGYLEAINGPSIELAHPLQIECLTPGA